MSLSLRNIRFLNMKRPSDTVRMAAIHGTAKGAITMDEKKIKALSDEELDKVAGGAGGGNQFVKVTGDNWIPNS